MFINFYGLGDNFDLNFSYVLFVFICKVYEVKIRGDSEIVVWGIGWFCCEFLYVDDCVDVFVFFFKIYFDLEYVNVGFGEDVIILEFVEFVCDVVGFEGCVVFDLIKFDGMLCKFMSVDKLWSMGWCLWIGFCEGIVVIYSVFLVGEYSEW